jgi:hypothetical protein
MVRGAAGLRNRVSAPTVNRTTAHFDGPSSCGDIGNLPAGTLDPLFESLGQRHWLLRGRGFVIIRRHRESSFGVGVQSGVLKRCTKATTARGLSKRQPCSMTPLIGFQGRSSEKEQSGLTQRLEKEICWSPLAFLIAGNHGWAHQCFDF